MTCGFPSLRPLSSTWLYNKLAGDIVRKKLLFLQLTTPKCCCSCLVFHCRYLHVARDSSRLLSAVSDETSNLFPTKDVFCVFRAHVEKRLLSFNVWFLFIGHRDQTLRSSGAAVSPVGEDAHHRRRPDPSSGLQSSGGTLPQHSRQTDHQQTAALHQQPHPAGERRMVTPITQTSFSN